MLGELAELLTELAELLSELAELLGELAELFASYICRHVYNESRVLHLWDWLGYRAAG